MISFFKDITPDNIILGREQCFSSNLSFFPLFYNYSDSNSKKKSPLICQINDLYSKYGVNTYSKTSKKSIDLILSEELSDLINNFNILNTLLESKLKEKITIPIRESKYDKFIRCKIPDFCKIYSSNEELIEIDNIKSRMFCDCIIQFRGIWILEESDHVKKVWYDLNLLQVRLDTPVFLKDYAFIDSKKTEISVKTETDCVNNINININNINSKPDKYKKMLAMGIPKCAVDRQMKLDGVTTATHVKVKCGLSINDMLKNSFKKGINLKKSAPVKRSPVKSWKPEGGHNAPSLSEITHALKFLKKIK